MKMHIILKKKNDILSDVFNSFFFWRGGGGGWAAEGVFKSYCQKINN